jgi:hypothetical protein
MTGTGVGVLAATGVVVAGIAALQASAARRLAASSA